MRSESKQNKKKKRKYSFKKSIFFFHFDHDQQKLTAGKAKPSADKQNAPNNEMNNSRLGIATANKTN